MLFTDRDFFMIINKQNIIAIIVCFSQFALLLAPTVRHTSLLDQPGQSVLLFNGSISTRVPVQAPDEQLLPISMTNAMTLRPPRPSFSLLAAGQVPLRYLSVSYELSNGRPPLAIDNK